VPVDQGQAGPHPAIKVQVRVKLPHGGQPSLPDKKSQNQAVLFLPDLSRDGFKKTDAVKKAKIPLQETDIKGKARLKVEFPKDGKIPGTTIPFQTNLRKNPSLMRNLLQPLDYGKKRLGQARQKENRNENNEE
jgi:hypothetical protein